MAYRGIKLNFQIAEEIRAAIRNGARHAVLAKKYGVDVSTISNIWRRKSWARNPDES